jgi:VIT1/CCC1 family predicted Fe2+/Mn2+ transporter
MAIVKCPECRKPVSDKARLCNHCGFTTKNASAEDIERAARILRLKQRHKLQMLVYGSMLMFLVGVLFYYFGRTMSSNFYLAVGYAGLILGGVGYVLSRIKGIASKRNT